MRIAILQRDADHRQQLERVLTECGHACVPSGDALSLARTLAASTVDMLLLDWQGSQIAGSELLSTLRAVNGSVIPVLFVSEDASDESVVRAFSVGADDNVCLPVCSPVLRARVNALLRLAFPERYENLTIDAGPYHFTCGVRLSACTASPCCSRPRNTGSLRSSSRISGACSRAIISTRWCGGASCIP